MTMTTAPPAASARRTALSSGSFNPAGATFFAARVAAGRPAAGDREARSGAGTFSFSGRCPVLPGGLALEPASASLTLARTASTEDPESARDVVVALFALGEQTQNRLLVPAQGPASSPGDRPFHPGAHVLDRGAGERGDVLVALLALGRAGAASLSGPR